jgi:hypothetical protein
MQGYKEFYVAQLDDLTLGSPRRGSPHSGVI